jgi:hypothetical protein
VQGLSHEVGLEFEKRLFRTKPVSKLTVLEEDSVRAFYPSDCPARMSDDRINHDHCKARDAPVGGYDDGNGHHKACMTSSDLM